MKLIATCDFTASLNGSVYSLRKGEAFTGSKEASEILSEQGLIVKQKEKKEGKDD